MSRLLRASALAMLLALGLGLGRAHADHVDGEEELLSGLLEVIRADDFNGNVAATIYRVQEKLEQQLPDVAQRNMELRFEQGKAPEGLQSGTRVQVRGRQSGSTFTTSSLAIVAQGGTTTTSTTGTVVPTVTGDKRALVIIVNFTDKANTSTVASLRSVLFDASSSMNAAYKDGSFGNVSWSGDVVGPYTINYQSTGTDYYSWGNAADSAATAAGVNISNYAYHIYAIPPNGTGYGGLGQMPGSKTWVFYESGKIYAHECGHNLGVHHASTPGSEYGDTSCFMGSAGLTHMNSPHKIALGWLGGSNVQTITQNGTYLVARSEDVRTDAQVLKIAKPDTGESYYVSVRRPIGFDAGLSTSFTSHTSIHRWNGYATTQTFMLGALADGASFNDSVNGITITQLSHDAIYSTVSVSFVPVPKAPTVTISPASQSGLAGATLNYTVTVKNNDSNGNPTATFNLASTVPASWTGTLTPSSLSLGPGASGTATFAVTSIAGAGGGSYPVTVSVSDTAQTLHTGSASATYSIDATPPTAPSNLTAKSIKKGINLSWTASTDNVAVTGYDILRNGVVVGSTSGTLYTDRPAAGTYTYTVRAKDAAGNLSPLSNSATGTRR